MSLSSPSATSPTMSATSVSSAEDAFDSPGAASSVASGGMHGGEAPQPAPPPPAALGAETFEGLLEEVRELAGQAVSRELADLATEAEEKRDVLGDALAQGQLLRPVEVTNLERYVAGLERVGAKLDARAAGGGGVVHWRGHADAAKAEAARWREELGAALAEHEAQAAEAAARLSAAQSISSEWIPEWSRRVGQWRSAAAASAAAVSCPEPPRVPDAPSVKLWLSGNTFEARSPGFLGGTATPLAFPCTEADLSACRQTFAARKIVDKASELLLGRPASAAALSAVSAACRSASGA